MDKSEENFDKRIMITFLFIKYNNNVLKINWGKGDY